MIIRKRKTKKALWVELRKQPHLSDKSDEQIRKRAYRKEAADFIKAVRAHNPYCPVVAAIPELYMSKSGRVVRVKVTQVHHKRGRNGTLLRDQRLWMAVSDRGHRWIHSHPDRSRARGWLCEKGQWNTEVPDGAGPSICLDTAASRIDSTLRQQEQRRCPKCSRPGIFIRTRYFPDGEADVWMCQNETCNSFRLYWHVDKPNQNPNAKLQATDTKNGPKGRRPVQPSAKGHHPHHPRIRIAASSRKANQTPKGKRAG